MTMLSYTAIHGYIDPKGDQVPLFLTITASEPYTVNKEIF